MKAKHKNNEIPFVKTPIGAFLTILVCIAFIILSIPSCFLIISFIGTRVDERNLQEILREQCNVPDDFTVSLDSWNNYDPMPNYHGGFQDMSISCHGYPWECICQEHESD